MRTAHQLNHLFFKTIQIYHVNRHCVNSCTLTESRLHLCISVV